jgi:hypothetical protein
MSEFAVRAVRVILGLLEWIPTPPFIVSVVFFTELFGKLLWDSVIDLLRDG